MVYWYLWWAGAALLMVSLVVVMAEDLLLVEVLGLSVTVVVGLDLSQDFPMVLLGCQMFRETKFDFVRKMCTFHLVYFFLIL